MKKLVFTLAAALLLMAVMPGTALAHGGRGRGYNQDARRTGYAPCTAEDCEVFYSHRHGRLWYCGQAGLDGDYETCRVDDCDAIGLHEHDGEYYHCQYYNTRTVRARGCCRS